MPLPCRCVPISEHRAAPEATTEATATCRARNPARNREPIHTGRALFGMVRPARNRRLRAVSTPGVSCWRVFRRLLPSGGSKPEVATTPRGVMLCGQCHELVERLQREIRGLRQPVNRVDVDNEQPISRNRDVVLWPH